MPPPACYTLHHEVTTGYWSVVDRLFERVLYFGTSTMTTNRYAGDLEDRWRARCAQWIDAEWRPTLLWRAAATQHTAGPSASSAYRMGRVARLYLALLFIF